MFSKPFVLIQANIKTRFMYLLFTARIHIHCGVFIFTCVISFHQNKIAKVHDCLEEAFDPSERQAHCICTFHSLVFTFIQYLSSLSARNKRVKKAIREQISEENFPPAQVQCMFCEADCTFVIIEFHPTDAIQRKYESERRQWLEDRKGEDRSKQGRTKKYRARRQRVRNLFCNTVCIYNYLYYIYI